VQGSCDSLLSVSVLLLLQELLASSSRHLVTMGECEFVTSGSFLLPIQSIEQSQIEFDASLRSTLIDSSCLDC